MNPRVKGVTPLSDFRLRLVFTDDQVRIFDVKPLLSYPIYQPLTSLPYFNRVRAELGTVSWPNEEDICPDRLFLESQPATDRDLSVS